MRILAMLADGNVVIGSDDSVSSEKNITHDAMRQGITDYIDNYFELFQLECGLM